MILSRRRRKCSLSKHFRRHRGQAISASFQRGKKGRGERRKNTSEERGKKRRKEIGSETSWEDNKRPLFIQTLARGWLARTFYLRRDWTVANQSIDLAPTSGERDTNQSDVDDRYHSRYRASWRETFVFVAPPSAKTLLFRRDLSREERESRDRTRFLRIIRQKRQRKKRRNYRFYTVAVEETFRSLARERERERGSERNVTRSNWLQKRREEFFGGWLRENNTSEERDDRAFTKFS